MFVCFRSTLTSCPFVVHLHFLSVLRSIHTSCLFRVHFSLLSVCCPLTLLVCLRSAPASRTSYLFVFVSGPLLRLSVCRSITLLVCFEAHSNFVSVRHPLKAFCLSFCLSSTNSSLFVVHCQQSRLCLSSINSSLFVVHYLQSIQAF